MKGRVFVQVLLVFSNNSQSSQELLLTNAPDAPEKQFSVLVVRDGEKLADSGISLFEVVPGLSNESKDFEGFLSLSSNEPLHLAPKVVVDGTCYCALSPGQSGWIVVSFEVPETMRASITSFQKLTAKQDTGRIVLTLSK
jgi:hypothetical protein